LRYLKRHNPLYAFVEINEQWFDQALANGEKLGRRLVEPNGEMDTDIAQGESMEDSNAFSEALCELEAVAHQSGFSIHAVPSDGNCMFSAVSHQLQITGVGSVDSNELREMVANHLEANSALYCDAVSHPVAPQDAYNADTEPPTVEDEYINSVGDSQLRLQLWWEQYMRGLLPFP